MTVAERIAEWLNEKQITHAFGIIGAGNATLWDAITRRQATQIICHHHEQAAVMAAASYYRVAGKLAAALVTTGAGSTNAITGVTSAFMDSTPVLVISGNEDEKYMNEPTRVWGVQGFDSVGMVKNVTKWADRAFMAHKVIGQLEEALEEALEPRRGPVWLDIPKNMANARL